MGGFAIQCKSDPEGEPACISSEDFVNLADSGALSWPSLYASDIDDRSKADWVIKSIALMQISWFVAQIFGRAVEHLPITTLELFTLGIVICAAVTYAAWWKKPFDVRMPLIVEIESRWLGSIVTLQRIRLIAGIDGVMPGEFNQHVYNFVYVPTIGLAFVAVHLLGWQFYFTTTTELWLWRASSLGCAAIPITLMALATIMLRAKKSKLLVVIAGPLCTLYALCMYMFVEMFAGLRAAPADVYRTPQWSQYLPSFG